MQIQLESIPKDIVSNFCDRTTKYQHRYFPLPTEETDLRNTNEENDEFWNYFSIEIRVENLYDYIRSVKEERHVTNKRIIRRRVEYPN